MGLSRCLFVLLALLFLNAPGGTFAWAEGPKRVVSINLCTDQLAIMLSAGGQLYSVSHLAANPRVSLFAVEAAKYKSNHALAEEVFLMQPDLVLAGSFSSRASVSILKRLGIRVEEFVPANSFAGIRANLLRMGALLGQEARARAIVSDMEQALARPPLPEGPPRPVAALTQANGYTSGKGTLADEVLARAGLDNLAGQLGLEGVAKLPLEVLVMAMPDVLVGEETWNVSFGRAYAHYAHPAMQAVAAQGASLSLPEPYWVCGTPLAARALEALGGEAARIKRLGLQEERSYE